MSGGVDSSVTACLLHEQGYEVTGLFMRTGVHEEPSPQAAACATTTANGASRSTSLPVLEHDRHRGCCSAIDASDARSVAGRLGVPFFALNFKGQFDRIIDYFVSEYERGRTPNPCVMCNEYLKFGRLAEYGRAVGADYVATGHYARIEQHDGQYRLLRGIDTAKDQSYVLFGIGRENLARTLLPIGGMTKSEVREHARRFGLPVSEKPDSVDICFVPDRDYARVVRERRPQAFVPGRVVDVTGREVGRHDGIANFTIGQRRGLGIALGEPAYVVAIDAETHTVTVGPRSALGRHELTAERMHWLIDPPAKPFRASVKIRYAHTAAPATVTPRGENAVHVCFDEPQFAVTPGQAAVIYDDDVVLGGGWIE